MCNLEHKQRALNFTNEISWMFGETKTKPFLKTGQLLARQLVAQQRGRVVWASDLKSVRSRVQILFWPLADVVLGSPEFSSSAALLNSLEQVCVLPVGILNSLCYIYNVWLFIYGVPNRPYSYSRYQTGTSLQVRLMQGSLFKCKLHSTLLNDIPRHKPPLHASSSPIPGKRIWPISTTVLNTLQWTLE